MRLSVIYIFFILSIDTSLVYSQNVTLKKNPIIKITGDISTKGDAGNLSGILFYEKLPNLSDAGYINTNDLGIFHFYVHQGEKYKISVKKTGFRTFVDEYVFDESGHFNIEMEKNKDFFRIENLNFGTSSDIILESSYDALDKLGNWLKKNKTIKIRLEGHTDFEGNAKANMILSKKRANAVKTYLKNYNIKKRRISISAFGGNQPVTRSRLPEEKNRNRRVEVRITKH